MSSASGKMKAISENAEEFRDLIAKLTGCSYEVREPEVSFPPSSDNASWYVFAPSMADKSSRYAHDLWKDDQSSIHIGSFYLGDTTQWIEGMYGERGAISASKIDYSDFAGARAILAKKFPAVEKDLRNYEKIVFGVSANHGVNVSIRYEGGNGGALFYLHAKIDTRLENAEGNRAQLERALEALKDAWGRLEIYESEEALKGIQHSHGEDSS
jgi:hypothetical protein